MDFGQDQLIGLVVAIPIVTTLLVLARRQQAASERRDAAAIAASERREDTQVETMRRFADAHAQTAAALTKVGEGQASLAHAVDRLNDRINDELYEVRAEVRGMRRDLDERTPPARPTGLYNAERGPKKEGG